MDTHQQLSTLLWLLWARPPRAEVRGRGVDRTAAAARAPPLAGPIGTAMRAALADLKVLHETGLLDDAGYLAAQQQWVARLAAGAVQEEQDKDEDEDAEAEMRGGASEATVAAAPGAQLATVLPSVPGPPLDPDRDERRRRRKAKKEKREAKARAAAAPEPEPEPEPELPPGHGTPLEPLCAVLPQLDRIAFTLALRAASLHLVKRDIEIDRRSLSAAMSSCGLPGKGKVLSACGFLMKESGKGGRTPAVLLAHLAPLGFTEMHVDCLVSTMSWVKDDLPPGKPEQAQACAWLARHDPPMAHTRARIPACCSALTRCVSAVDRHR